MQDTVRPADVQWRDQLARLACAFGGAAAIMSLPVLGLGLSVLQDRVLLMSVAATLGLVLLGAAWLRVPRTVRSALAVGVFVVCSWVGYVAVGPVPGPMAMFAVAVLLALLLLGRGALVAVIVLGLGGAFAIGWAMSAGVLAAPDPADTAPTLLRTWVRSTTVAALALSALAVVVAWVVARLERSIAREREEARLRLEAETARFETERRALASQRLELVGRLAAGLAHDVNNLLNVITVVSSQLPEGAAPGVRAEIEDAAGQASAMLKQLVMFSKGRTRTPSELSLKRLVEADTSTLTRIAPASVTLAFELSGTACVSAEEVQLHRVLLNFAVNALDAVGPTGGTVTVRTRDEQTAVETAGVSGAIPAGAWSVLEVEDDGPGMDEATKQRAVEPFFTTKAPHKGSGLGLASVADIARQHGGHLTLWSEKGVGTRIALWLPASGAAPQP